MEFNKRKPLVILNEPIPGYTEGDQDYIQDNLELCVAFLNFLDSVELGMDLGIKGGGYFNKVTMVKSNRGDL